MNISAKQKQPHGHREQREVGKGWIGSVGLADANYYIQDK